MIPLRVDRRSFVAALLAAALAERVRAQRVHTLGYLAVGGGAPRRLAARLAELGYVEGKNLRIVLRRVPETPSREQMDQAARELASSGAHVLVASGALTVAALHRATSKIPIVTGGVSNPVGLGLARSLREPGMNVTGLSFGLEQAAALQFGAFRLLRPRLQRVVFLLSETDPDPRVTPEHAAAAGDLGISTEVATVGRLEQVERLFASMRDHATEAAWVAPLSPDIPLAQLAASAVRHRIATHAMGPPAVREGLLFSYWLLQADATQRLAVIIDKVLRGADPATIPFELPDKPELALNQRTAAAIGARIPDELRIRATDLVG